MTENQAREFISDDERPRETVWRQQRHDGDEVGPTPPRVQEERGL
jgi:hypothetical protein